jgi:hypothetical protein
MRTASTWHGVRTLAPVVLLGTVTGLALQGCMSVEVRVDPARRAPSQPTAYYGVVENDGWSSGHTDTPTPATSGDCWAS